MSVYIYRHRETDKGGCHQWFVKQMFQLLRRSWNISLQLLEYLMHASEDLYIALQL